MTQEERKRILNEIEAETQKVLDKYTLEEICGPGFMLTQVACHLLNNYNISEEEMFNSLKRTLEIARTNLEDTGE